MISFLFMGCPCGRFQDIEVYNNTKDSIFVYLAMNLKDSKDAIYPDTMLPIRDRFRIQDDTDLGKWPRGVFALIPPFSKGFVNHVYGEDNLEHYLPYDTLSVFFINKNAMEELGYDSVRAQQKYIMV